MRLHQRMTGWRTTDAALSQLATTNPSFDEASCLLKSVAVNALYGTQIRAIVRMAGHVRTVVSKTNLSAAGSELVEKIAAMPARRGETERTFLSFAAKFCHFFIDTDRFPIYDDAARFMLRYHLGGAYQPSKEKLYHAFSDAFTRLRLLASLDQGRDLDRYLWIAGMYSRWLRQRTKEKPLVNAELLTVFRKPATEDKRDLDAMLPSQFERPFLMEA